MRPKLVLLGGSNSVKKNGLSHGLAEGGDLANLALGATSSLQNLYAALKHRDLVCQADAVVTESNVNDSHAVAQFAVDPELILGGIDDYYRELANLNPNAIVLLTPLNRTSPRLESEEIVDLVIARHRRNVRRHGLFLIDLVRAWKDVAPRELDFLMPDARHVATVYLYNLGVRIADHVARNAALLAARRQGHRVREGSHYIVVTAPELAPGGTQHKSNSFCSEDVLELADAPLTLPERHIGRRLAAIGTWSDKHGGLELTNRSTTIVKAFNVHNAFNEICAPFVIDEETVIRVSRRPAAEATERSLNITAEARFGAPVKLTGLLLKDEGAQPPPVPESEDASISLAGLIPDPALYIASLREFVPDVFVYSRKVRWQSLEDAAVLLAGSHPEKSRDLLRIADRVIHVDQELRARVKNILLRQATPEPGFPLRPVGRTGLQVTELGFGSAPLGNLFRPLADADARATLTTATGAGFGYFDTAPFYGFGLSERRLGDALRGREYILSTKVGRVLNPISGPVKEDEVRHGYATPMPFEPVYDYSYDAVMRSYRDSLQRLGLARIDLLYIHDIGRMTHGGANAGYMAQLTDGGGLKALEELRASGAIAGFGMGVNEIPACLEVMAHARLDAILLAGRYTLLEQEALDELFPACLAAGTSIVIGGPYNSGILALGTRAGAALTYNYEPAPQAIIAKVAAIEEVCAFHGVPLPAAALQFPLAHPLVASVIPGVDSAARVEQTLALYRHPIPTGLWRDLKSAGLLRKDAPTPTGSPA